MHPPLETEIWSAEIVETEGGRREYVINQDTRYDLGVWIIEEAEEDYRDPKRGGKTC